MELSRPNSTIGPGLLQQLSNGSICDIMASFGRTRLMGVTIKRFLKQVKRSEPADYETLPETLRQRYNHHRPHQSLEYLTPAQYAATVGIPGALPPIPRNLPQDGSRHEQKETGQPQLADAPIIAACSGCIPAGPYPCRDTESIGYKTGEFNTAEKMN